MTKKNVADKLFRQIAKMKLPARITRFIITELRRHQAAGSPVTIVVQEIETILAVWKENSELCKNIGLEIRSVAEQKATRTLSQMFPQIS